jgi:hypothetical protein
MSGYVRHVGRLICLLVAAVLGRRLAKLQGTWVYGTPQIGCAKAKGSSHTCRVSDV